MLIRNCYYPITAIITRSPISERMEEHRGAQTVWMGREEFSHQAKRDARAGSGRDGEASAGHAECHRWGGAQERLFRSTKGKEPWIQTPALAFRAVKPWTGYLHLPQRLSSPGKRDPPLSSLLNTVRIRTQCTSGTSDKEKMYSESYSDMESQNIRQKPSHFMAKTMQGVRRRLGARSGSTKYGVTEVSTG